MCGSLWLDAGWEWTGALNQTGQIWDSNYRRWADPPGWCGAPHTGRLQHHFITDSVVTPKQPLPFVNSEIEKNPDYIISLNCKLTEEEGIWGQSWQPSSAVMSLSEVGDTLFCFLRGGGGSCCNSCSALCWGHLYIVKHVSSAAAPSPPSGLWALTHSDRPGCKDAADNHSFK